MMCVGKHPYCAHELLYERIIADVARQDGVVEMAPLQGLNHRD